METIWVNSPDYWYNVYIGGSNALCPAGTVPSWLNTVQAQGWSFEYTTVGLQPPCTNFINTFSADTSTAYSQGENMAQAAINQLINDGVSPAGNQTPLIYDLESAGNGTCQAAINSFVGGFDYWTLAAGYIPGVYGSICGSNLTGLIYASSVPYFIWGADPDGNPNPALLNDGPNGCGVPNSQWTSNQRLKQYSSGGAGTYYGVYFPSGIDYDCADSWTSPYGTAVNC